MTPTGRNTLLNLLMSGAKSTFSNEQPVERLEMLPFARYQNGGVFPAVPGFLNRAGNALMGSGRNTYPETFQPEGPQDVYSAAAYQDAQRGLEGAIPLMGGGALATGAGATRNALGIFGGRLAKTADQAALAKAESMAAEGAPREQIWNDTGWFQGVDGKWRFEIDDSSYRYRYGAAPGRVSNALSHDKLADAYPESMGLNLTFESPRGGAFWNSNDKTISLSNVQHKNDPGNLLHELQHSIQDKEGFSKGGNIAGIMAEPLVEAIEKMAALRDPIRREIDNITNRLEGLVNESSRLKIEDANAWLFPMNKKRINEISLELKALRQNLMELRYKEVNLPAINREMRSRDEASDIYRRLSGEVEARTVDGRKNLSPEQRRARAPWLDYDVPESQQIVRFK